MHSNRAFTGIAYQTKIKYTLFQPQKNNTVISVFIFISLHPDCNHLIVEKSRFVTELPRGDRIDFKYIVLYFN